MAHIVIISASVGAGHDGAAAELARRLAAAGHTADRYDFVELLPAPLGSVLARAYRRQLVSAPWCWRATVATFDQRAPAGAAAWSTHAADARILGLVRPDTAAVVSTYPLASQALGRLRRAGALTVPAITYLTDPYVHRTWIARGVDAHLAVHAATAAHAQRLGAAGVQLVAPAVAPAFRPPTGPAETAAARRAFRLPPTGPLALIVAGSLGLGRPDRTAAEVIATGLATPVVACGRHLTLHQRLTGTTGLVSLGWVADMPTLMRATDLVIHNAGGLTSLEALASGLPVLTYRPVAGHGRANATVLDRAGTIPWVRAPAHLPRALRAALTRAHLPAAPTAPDPATAITRAFEAPPVHTPTRHTAPRTTVRPAPRLRPPTRNHS